MVAQTVTFRTVRMRSDSDWIGPEATNFDRAVFRGLVFDDANVVVHTVDHLCTETRNPGHRSVWAEPADSSDNSRGK
jgi:hypothetical protein